jgi:eight-cysteine-cluster-containing protein
MKKLLIIFSIILLISISGCVTSTPVIQCTKDEDCITGGCSGELCGKKGEFDNIASPCIWKEEYTCLRLTRCQCIQNKCQWNQTPEYQQCLANITP